MQRTEFAVALLAGFLCATSALAQLATRTSVAEGVTVKVTPKSLAMEASAWEFAVVLDTHTRELSDDLVKTSVIVAPDGRRLAPTGWAGGGPGGHHREGVLRFEAIKPRPAAIELQIHRPGESAPRAFRWGLN